ncbi:hypothetical protein [Desulfococcus sp.]|uniref:hypothetical protein n=1 Tax=Desulfococcus sp. TaxID=2025834 RepID=UPI003593E6D1
MNIGIAVCHWEVRAGLRGWKLGRSLFVADSGMISEDKRKELARACGKYIPAWRMPNVAGIRKDVPSKRGSYTVFKENFHAKEVVAGDASSAGATSAVTTPRRLNVSANTEK